MDRALENYNYICCGLQLERNAIKWCTVHIFLFIQQLKFIKITTTKFPLAKNEIDHPLEFEYGNYFEKASKIRLFDIFAKSWLVAQRGVGCVTYLHPVVSPVIKLPEFSKVSLNLSKLYLYMCGIRTRYLASQFNPESS